MATPSMPPIAPPRVDLHLGVGDLRFGDTYQRVCKLLGKPDGDRAADYARICEWLRPERLACFFSDKLVSVAETQGAILWDVDVFKLTYDEICALLTQHGFAFRKRLIDPRCMPELGVTMTWRKIEANEAGLHFSFEDDSQYPCSVDVNAPKSFSEALWPAGYRTATE